ncbi:MAG: asparagine synthase-related protein [Microbacteriaceae bacterium]
MPEPTRIDSADGVPWIVGAWPAQHLRHHATGTTSLVVLGRIDATSAALERVLRSGNDAVSIAEAVLALPGSFYVFTRTADEAVSIGTRSGLRRLFETETDGSRVLASHAAALAHLYRKPIAVQKVGAKLFGQVPGAAAAEPLWDGVDVRSPFHLQVDDPRTFQPITSTARPMPESSRSLEQGAGAVREAITSSIRARSMPGASASADVSGIDSGTVYALAHGTYPDLRAVTMASRDDGDDDVPWAREVVRVVDEPGNHLVITPEYLPVFYEDVEPTLNPAWLDYPSPTILDLRRQTAGYPQVAAGGSRLHFTGMGGDHLFSAMPVHYQWDRALYRRDRRQARALFQLDRPPRPGKAPSYTRWLTRVAESLEAGDLSSIGDDWELAPREIPWATRTARVDAAHRVRPPQVRFSDDPIRNFEFALLWTGTEALLPLERATAELGMELVSPFFDDHVIDNAFSVQLPHRISLTEYKPLLSAAASPVLPSSLRRRNTKGTAILDEFLGVERHREKLRSIFTGSLLGQAGLIDEHLLRTLIDYPSDRRMNLADFDQTLALESWLRLQERTPFR